MNTSLFFEIVEKYFKAVIGKITERFNGKKQEEQMLHKTMLTEEYSADLTWGATELEHSIVAADVVALDSSLPLKKRGSFGNASGKLPKLGVKFRKGEKDISNINIMRARGTDEATVAAKVFDDASKSIKAIEVRKEMMFEEGLSTGLALATEADNDGTGVRVNYGYKGKNICYATAAAWGETGYDPIDDIRQMFDKASEDSNSIGLVLLSKKYFNFIRSSVSGKKLVADYRGQIYQSTDLLQQPGRQSMLDALADEFGATFRIVDSTFRVQNADGSTTSVRPWKEANLVGVPAENVGRLVYGTLAEETNPVTGVSYQKSGSHILVSKYSKTDPLEEFTAAQAVCLPVIDGADGIYILQADTMFVDKSKLEFAKTADSTGQTITASGSGTITATKKTTASWCTATVSNQTVTVTVSANSTSSAPAREVVLEIRDNFGHVSEVTVKQAANA